MRVMHSFPSKANLDQSKNQFIIQVENDGSKKGTCEPQGWPSKAAMLACMSATATGHIVFMSTWFSLSYKKWDSSHHALEDFFWKLMFATWKGKQVTHHKSFHFFYSLYILWCVCTGKTISHSISALWVKVPPKVAFIKFFSCVKLSFGHLGLSTTIFTLN